MGSEAEHPPVAQPELDAWGDYLRAEGKRPKTVSTYLSIVGKLLAAYPDTKFADFTQRDIERHLEGVDEKYRGRDASMARLWFRWGELTDQIVDVRNPTRHLPKYKWVRSGPVRDLFSEAEMAKLNGLPHPDGVLMEVLFETGIKTGEARTLVGKCCELDVPQIRIIESAAPRFIPISDRAFRDRLARMLEVEKIGPNDCLWYSRPGGTSHRRHGRTLSGGALLNWWTRCLETAGVEYRMMRTTRNTFARRMQNEGVPLADLSLWMGHNDYYTTNEYYAAGRLPDARQRVSSMREATAVIRHQRDLLQRALPHLLTPGAPGATELAKEIAADLAE